MASESISVHLVTPQGPVADENTDAVLAPGRLGQFEILEGHVPFLSELHAGVLTFGEASEKKYYAVGPGFLEVEPNGVVQVLCEQAQAAADIDGDAAQAKRDAGEEKLAKWEGAMDGEYRTLKSELDWAQACLDTLQISGNGS